MKDLFVHRLVAFTFLDYDENKKYVNHKDGNKLNNDLDNLEWVTSKENKKHASKNNLITTTKIMVYQYSLDNTYIRYFNSIIEASKHIGKSSSSISACCRGDQISCGNFKWSYEKLETWVLPTRKDLISLYDDPHIVSLTLMEYPKYIIQNNGSIYSIVSNKFMKYSVRCGYPVVKLYNKNKKPFVQSVHKIMAIAFIKNENSITKTDINHKDGNKLNYNPNNLEWVSKSENMKHAFQTGLATVINEKPIYQYNKNYVFIRKFKSITDAANYIGPNKYNRNFISSVINKHNNRKSAFGYIWLAEEYINPIVTKQIIDQNIINSNILY